MTFVERQQIFTKNLGLFILWAFDNGHTITMGEVWRSDEQHALNIKKGKTKAKRSLHQDRLAFDCNLFRGETYITYGSAYSKLGEYWVSLHPHNRWGGDWNKNGESKDEKFVDGNHFEMQIL